MITESYEEDRNKKYSYDDKLLKITITLNFEKISSPIEKINNLNKKTGL